jgi:flavodoxin
MPKILVVYYSRTGNSKKVAEILQKELGCDIEEIIAQSSYAGIKGYIRAAREGIGKIAAKINPASKNAADYDIVIVGGPVWGRIISSPIRAYLEQNKDKIKNMASFCTMGGDKGKSFQETERICNKSLVAKIAIKAWHIASGKAEEQIKSYCATILNNIK